MKSIECTIGQHHYCYPYDRVSPGRVVNCDCECHSELEGYPKIKEYMGDSREVIDNNIQMQAMWEGGDASYGRTDSPLL